MGFLHVGTVLLRPPKLFIWKRKRSFFFFLKERVERFIIISDGRPELLNRELCLEEISWEWDEAQRRAADGF